MGFNSAFKGLSAIFHTNKGDISLQCLTLTSQLHRPAPGTVRTYACTVALPTAQNVGLTKSPPTLPIGLWTLQWRY